MNREDAYQTAGDAEIGFHHRESVENDLENERFADRD
jgi:hypothetical protein